MSFIKRGCFCCDLPMFCFIIGCVCTTAALTCFVSSLLIFNQIDERIELDNQKINRYDIFAAENLNEFVKLKQQRIEDNLNEKAYDELLVYAMITSSVIFISSICLSVGVTTKRRCLMLPWLISGMITILGNIFQMVYVLDEAEDLPTTYIFQLSGVFVVQSVILGLNIYFWICVRELYISMMKSRGPIDNSEEDEDEIGLPGYTRFN